MLSATVRSLYIGEHKRYNILDDEARNLFAFHQLPRSIPGFSTHGNLFQEVCCRSVQGKREKIKRKKNINALVGHLKPACLQSSGSTAYMALSNIRRLDQ